MINKLGFLRNLALMSKENTLIITAANSNSPLINGSDRLFVNIIF